MVYDYDPRFYCHKCGEKPLFGSLTNGLCSECLEKERREKELQYLRHVENRKEAEKRVREILEQNDKFHREMMEQSERQHQQLLDTLLPWQECEHCHRQERKDRIVTKDSKTYCQECGGKFEVCSACGLDFIKDEPVFVYSTNEDDSVDQAISLDRTVVCNEVILCPACLSKDRAEKPMLWANQVQLKDRYEAQIEERERVELEKQKAVEQGIEAKRIANRTRNQEIARQKQESKKKSMVVALVSSLVLAVILLVENFYLHYSRVDMAITIGIFSGVSFLLGIFKPVLIYSAGVFFASILAILLNVMVLLIGAIVFVVLLSVTMLLDIFFDCENFFGNIFDTCSHVLSSDAAIFIYFCLLLVLSNVAFAFLYGGDPQSDKNEENTD